MVDRVLALAVGLCCAASASAQHLEDVGCDPRVRDALVAAAEAGVVRDLAAIRDPEQGIRDPEPLAAFSCLERAFDYGRHDVFFQSGDVLERLLRGARRQVCGVAREAWRRAVGRPFDVGVFTGGRPRLPGLDGEVPQDRAVERLPVPERIEGTASAAERFRGIVGSGR